VGTTKFINVNCQIYHLHTIKELYPIGTSVYRQIEGFVFEEPTAETQVTIAITSINYELSTMIYDSA